MRIAPVFGAGALAVSQRVGHSQVTVDDAPWHWADASGTPFILRGLPPGVHKVLIELVDANHQPVDRGTITFEVPKIATAAHLRSGGADITSALSCLVVGRIHIRDVVRADAVKLNERRKHAAVNYSSTLDLCWSDACDSVWTSFPMTTTEPLGTLYQRLQFEVLVADLSARFVNLPTGRVDGAIEDAQRQLVEMLDLDRITLWELSGDGNELRPTHHWSRPGLLQPSTRLVAEEAFPWITAKVLRGETVTISRLDEVPRDTRDRESLLCVGTKSTVTVPLLVRGRVVGAAAFAVMREERSWEDDLVNRLRLVAQVFANVLARKRSDEELRAALAEVSRLRDRLKDENEYLKREVGTLHGAGEIVGDSLALRRVLDQVRQVAPTGATVLLLGETGTGKELIASQIHAFSTRRSRMMVRINCAAIPAALVESELFGRERGAYTGALSRQIGRFELADQSTLFLDEIGDLPPDVQVKLLRVLQEKTIERLGSSKRITLDVRIVAATHCDLEQGVAEGKFREDLYYRLNVFPITIPPLRERPGDVPALVWRCVDECCKTFGKHVDSISKDNMLALQRYAWPGNVRELRNVVERAVIVSRGPRLVIDLPNGHKRAAAARSSVRLSDVERDHIYAVLESTGWRVRGSGGGAELLGMKASTLESRMAKLGVRRPPR